MSMQNSPLPNPEREILWQRALFDNINMLLKWQMFFVLRKSVLSNYFITWSPCQNTYAETYGKLKIRQNTFQSLCVIQICFPPPPYLHFLCSRKKKEKKKKKKNLPNFCSMWLWKITEPSHRQSKLDYIYIYVRSNEKLGCFPLPLHFEWKFLRKKYLRFVAYREKIVFKEFLFHLLVQHFFWTHACTYF